MIGICIIPWIIVLLIFMVILILPAVIIHLKIFQRNALWLNILYFYIVGTVCVFIILFGIPIENSFAANEENLDDKKYLNRGCLQFVYKIKDNDDFVFKKFIKFNEKEAFKYLHTLPENKKCLIDLLVYNFVRALEWKSIEINNKYYGLVDSIPLIKNINHNNLTYWQERCTPLTKNDYELVVKQLKKINKQLSKYNLFYLDANSDNVMLDKNKKIKFIDGTLSAENMKNLVCFTNGFAPVGVGNNKMDRILFNYRKNPIIDSYWDNKLIKSNIF